MHLASRMAYRVVETSRRNSKICSIDITFIDMIVGPILALAMIALGYDSV